MRCVIAGGGTGGHLFPGIAIAEAFVEKERGNEVLFIGTERGIEKRILASGRYPLITISSRPLRGTSFYGKLKTLSLLPRAVMESYRVLKEYKPNIVIGVGGYASGPVLLAAFLLGLPRAIHEQNMIPGATNQLLRGFVQRIFVSFEETKSYFPEAKTIVTGNPLRKNIAFLGSIKRKEDRFTLLIFGGSAGAHRINVAMIEALNFLEGLRGKIKMIHQTGKDDRDFVIRGYAEKGFEAEVKPFIEEMGYAYQRADLVISRAGASTISELAVCGKASLLIPYPYAAHQHQLIHAKKLMERGAAMMIRDEEVNGHSLAQAILYLYEHPEEREKMEAAIKKIGRPQAAQEIVEHCYRFMKR
ncbi:MAG: undecaprenyldiphospho-muramoylpentapeptide beta-N-acetylglucosaminyltransferase [Thermodesulfobacteriota bacterium]